eukprot:gb/GECH01003545.1/.p1 GENE.gb/GECH01003545.1/~~gb/GECH01003545.1/.p1  ORF type:complete len:531 (+),score=58.25 gb/GECH01003545.1/:1-1593(+)
MLLENIPPSKIEKYCYIILDDRQNYSSLKDAKANIGNLLRSYSNLTVNIVTGEGHQILHAVDNQQVQNIQPRKRDFLEGFKTSFARTSLNEHVTTCINDLNDDINGTISDKNVSLGIFTDGYSTVSEPTMQNAKNSFNTIWSVVYNIKPERHPLGKHGLCFSASDLKEFKPRMNELYQPNTQDTPFHLQVEAQDIPYRVTERWNLHIRVTNNSSQTQGETQFVLEPNPYFMGAENIINQLEIGSSQNFILNSRCFGDANAKDFPSSLEIRCRQKNNNRWEDVQSELFKLNMRFVIQDLSCFQSGIDRKLNILFLGTAGSGKSSLVKSCFWYFGEIGQDPVDVGYGPFQRTLRVNSYEPEEFAPDAQFRLIDTPGLGDDAGFLTMARLEHIMNGKWSSNAELAELEYNQENENFRIDGLVFVTSGTNTHNQLPYDYGYEVSKLAEYKQVPMILVLTNADKVRHSIRDRVIENHAREIGMAKDDILFHENYHSGHDQKRSPAVDKSTHIILQKILKKAQSSAMHREQRHREQ